MSKSRAVISRTNHSINILLSGYFDELINTILVFEENENVREAMSLGEEAHRKILDQYKSILKANKNVRHIYSGYKNKLMLINDYPVDKGFDPTDRPWYRAAMASRPGTSIGLPYEDYMTGERLISTSRALRQAGGGYGGVVSIDCSVNRLVDLIAQQNEYETEYSFVMDLSGKMIVHPDPALLGKPIGEITAAYGEASKGDFDFRLGRREFLAHFSSLPSLGWIVVTVVERTEIFRPFISQALFLIGLTGLIAVFLGSLQSIVLSRRLSRPLLELGKKIKATIAGEEPGSGEYIYPNNEFGVMAWEIEQLAEKELNAKTRKLQASEEKHRLLIEHTLSAVAVHDIILDEGGKPVDYDFQSANPAFEIQTGLRVADILGRRATEVMPGNPTPPFLDIFGQVALTGGSVSFEEYCPPLGRHYFINAYRLGEGRFATVFMDITDRKEAEERIQKLVAQLETERDLAQSNSLTDSMTGLFNRRFFDTALRTEFSRHKRLGSHLSLIMLDVDHFKKFNDRYGHLAGDDCLRRIAEALKTVVERAPDIVARYGGEEFVALLPNTNSRGAALLAGRIREAVLRMCLSHADSETSEFVTISLGVATATDHLLTDEGELVALADQALYQAKTNGRNRIEVLTATL
ncbi:diguanylate cyclase domain-containing protein [Desulfuromonas soudanensis]|uniref:diguanylate cyclase domain-containing protein n=1 Tax=Desulfuromonas soudanensis TaxID=1603606 RepID=UPI0022B6CEF1|nr:diguanylate cyclase [Desulfuromonas soudanensis]